MVDDEQGEGEGAQGVDVVSALLHGGLRDGVTAATIERTSILYYRQVIDCAEMGTKRGLVG
ncbi:hypothetical protein GCM10027430_22460 [Lysobacter tyrosinilyticus]